MSQDVLTRHGVDSKNSENTEPDFWDLALWKLNDLDEVWVPETEALPDLHSDFSGWKRRPKGNFVWTREVGIMHLNDLRRALTSVINNYEKSGNGSNKATQEDENN